jgi:hypothetical protein
MAIRNKYFPGSTVSRHLPVGERSWDEGVFQSGKPVLDAELQLEQEIGQHVRNLLVQAATPSGWLRGPQRFDPFDAFVFPAPADPTFTANAFWMRKRTALVAGRPVVVEFTETATSGMNLIQLDSPPLFGGAPPDVKRTDFVFLEVWLALVSMSPRASGTCTVLPALPTALDTLVIGGVTLTAVAGAPAVDQFTIGANEAATAANIAAAINNPANSFTGTATAAQDITSTDVVNIYAVAVGAAGNAVTLVETGVGWTISGATLAGGADTSNKPTQSTLYRHGNVLANSGVNLTDDIADPVVMAETAKRVQVQYRIRKTGQTEAVNFKTEQDGFSNVNVLAQGGQAAPVATYPFLPADNSTSSGNSDATAYQTIDPGLWIAGDGSSAAATALGSVDGYVYAIPMCFSFRRNDAFNSGAGSGFAPLDNVNGALPSTHALFVNPVVGSIPVNTSDRPDGRFSDAIVAGDILDLRRHVSPGGVDLTAELRNQMQLLLDGSLATWAIDGADKQDLGAGSGDVSWRHLVCNEVGRSGAEGGVAPASGDTTRGVTVRNFDHISRRFADQPVVERIVFGIFPTDTQIAEPGKYVDPANLGYSGWAEGDALHIDLANLNATGDGTWADATKTYSGGPGGGSVTGLAPPGTQITNVLGMWHDDGNYGNPAISQTAQPLTITGMGTAHVVVTLDSNISSVNGGDVANPVHPMVGSVALDNGSSRRIFIELEITYPLGSGTTDTPDETLTPAAAVYTSGAVLENDTTQRPGDMELLQSPLYREAKRELHFEYVANTPGSGFGSGTPISDSIVSASPTALRFPRRLYGSGAHLTAVTDSVVAQAHDIDSSNTEYGSSSRVVALDVAGPGPTKAPLSGAGQTLCAISYFAQDPIPNYGAVGYQIAAYFRTQSPQTAGTQAGVVTLPDPMTVRPMVMSKDLWTGTTGPGSADVPFPYGVPMDQIPVHGDVPVGTFPGEWYFAASAQISVDDFDATTGLLNLHAMVPGDGTDDFTFSSADKDVEFRSHFKVADTSAYRPTIFAQPLSGAGRHKVWAPFLAVVTADNAMWRAGEVVLVVVSRFAELDDENTIRFVNTSNRTCAGIYRTRGMLLLATE